MTDSPLVTDVASLARIRALRSRRPGYAVAQKCLEVQAAAEMADPSLRSERSLRLHPDAWPWYVGALGEMEVGARLAELGPDWLVLHAVPIGTGTKDIDHLVVGPPGVFAINSKRHLGASIWVGDHVLRVNDRNTGHLAQARADAAEATRRLAERVDFPVSAWSVVTIVGGRTFGDIRRESKHHPYVTPAHDLVPWLRSAPAVLTPAQLGLLRLAAEEPDTWHVDPSAADTLRVMQRFDRLRGMVGDRPARPVTDAVRAPGAPTGSATRVRGAGGRRRSARRIAALIQACAAFGAAVLLATHPTEVARFVTTLLGQLTGTPTP